MNLQSPNLNGHLVEVEYAVVDKSKKNRFTSLPALNGYNGNAAKTENEDKDHPPVPPKKHLHKRFVLLNKRQLFINDGKIFCKILYSFQRLTDKGVRELDISIFFSESEYICINIPLLSKYRINDTF